MRNFIKSIMVLGLFLMLFACSKDTNESVMEPKAFVPIETDNLSLLAVKGEEDAACMDFKITIGFSGGFSVSISTDMTVCCHGQASMPMGTFCNAYPTIKYKKGSIPINSDGTTYVQSSVPVNKNGYKVTIKPGYYHVGKDGGLQNLVFILTKIDKS